MTTFSGKSGRPPELPRRSSIIGAAFVPSIDSDRMARYRIDLRRASSPLTRRHGDSSPPVLFSWWACAVARPASQQV